MALVALTMNRSTDTANPRGKEAQGAVSDGWGLRKEVCTLSADLGMKTLRPAPHSPTPWDREGAWAGPQGWGPHGSPEGRRDNLPTQQEWTTSNGKSGSGGW